MSEEEVTGPAQDTLDAASNKIASMMAPPEPEPEPEPETAAPEPPADNQITQAQRQLASYQYQLAQEHAALQAEEKAIASLRRSDPAEYSARAFDLMQAKEQFAMKASQLQQATQQFDSQHSEKAAKEHMRWLESQKKTLERDLQWNTEKAQKLVKYLRGKGWSDQELLQVTDARAVKLAWQAMQNEQGKKKTLPKRKTTPQDARARVDADLRRRNESPHSVKAAGDRIAAMGLFRGAR